MRKLWIGMMVLMSLWGVVFGEVSAGDLLQRMERMFLPQGAIYTSEFTIVRGGKKSLYTLRMWARQKDFVAVVEKPYSDAGTVFLYRGGDAWVYYPSIDKRVKSSAKEKVLGGDFSMADFSSLELTKNYTATLESKPVVTNAFLPAARIAYVVKCTSKEGVSVAYPVVFVYFDEQGMPVAQELYTISGYRLGVMIYEDVGSLGGVIRPRRIIMRTSLVEENYSLLEYKEAVYKTVPAEYFAPEGMKKLSGKK